MNDSAKRRRHASPAGKTAGCGWIVAILEVIPKPFSSSPAVQKRRSRKSGLASLTRLLARNNFRIARDTTRTRATTLPFFPDEQCLLNSSGSVI
jgi:hypothetical protein